MLYNEIKDAEEEKLTWKQKQAYDIFKKDMKKYESITNRIKNYCKKTVKEQAMLKNRHRLFDRNYKDKYGSFVEMLGTGRKFYAKDELTDLASEWFKRIDKNMLTIYKRSTKKRRK